MKHATVRLSEYEVPLIGVPASATQEKCADCGKLFHLSEIELDLNGRHLCPVCKEKAGRTDGETRP